ncbi:MAG: hypothetical protein IPK15_14600 [Verrucomicrobia bacterium]|nr:hypothetical protein [Verrucomicrobiota bacterium]
MDISNPATPQLVGSSAFPNTQQNGFDSLKVSKSFAFVGYYGGTLVMDVTNPPNQYLRLDTESARLKFLLIIRCRRDMSSWHTAVE